MKNLCGTSLLVTSVLATAGFTTMAMGQVANDECSTATVVTAGVPVAFTNVGATSSADPAPVDTFCTGTFLNWGTTNPDVWFRFTAAESGNADFSTCDIAGFDTSMVLYTGTCGALTQVGCNGDAIADASCQQYFSKITGFSVTAGTTYYIRIGGYTDPALGAATGSATFSVTLGAAGCNGATGGCGVVHATPGCDDATCCNAVCAANPFCCDTGWDATCVQDAVATCGIFVYQCITPNAAVANDCAPAATVITSDTSRVVNNTGCNTDGPDHSGATCNSGNDFFLNDVWYRFQSPANSSLRVYTCATTFDTKLAVYNMGTNPATYDYNTLSTTLVGCNDDGDGTACGADGSVFPSDLTVNVVQNNWYLVRVATYDVPGNCTVFFDLPEPCALPAQTGFEAEACGSATNNGCNAAGETETIIVGSRTKGTFATFTDPVSGANTRDTDFYRLDVTADTQVTVNIYSRSFVTGLVLGGNITTAACAGVNVIGTASGNCPSTGSVCLNPGTYYIFVAPSSFTGLPCGSGVANDYVLEVLGAPASCPDVVDQVCADPSVNSYVSSAATLTTGMVSCGAFGAAPACAGAQTANTYARPMPAGAIGGSITCLNFGVFSARRAPNAGACANFASDLPLPVTIGVYEDVDGGAPRNKIATAGDGNDLRLIEQREVLVPGGVYLANLDFDPPLCLDGVVGNIVVVMDCPDLNTAGATPSIPAGVGYRIIPAGGVITGQGSGTYGRLGNGGVCGTLNSPAYTLMDTLVGSAVQWVVSFNGDFAGCGTPCPTDLNGDGSTGSADLSILLNGWGGTSPDLNGDGSVGSADLSVLLNGWGACP